MGAESQTIKKTATPPTTKSSQPVSQHSFGRIAVRPKLLANIPGDEFEQEADRIADQVSLAPTTQVPVRALVQRQSNSNDGVQVSGAAESQIQSSTHGGQPLPASARKFFEPRLGFDFSRVRIHSDAQAANLAQPLHARAFTLGQNIWFGEGQYAPTTAAGNRLLAHELTHVAQQQTTPSHSAAPARLQRNIFGDIWEGVKSVGRAIGGAARAVGSAIAGAFDWVAERLGDAGRWVVGLIRDLPARLVRLAQTVLEGLEGAITFIPEAIQALASGGIRGFGDWLWEKAKSGGAWILTLVSRVLDVMGGPEIAEFILHLITRSSPLTGAEIAAAQSVLGPNAIRWGDVRVAEGGLLTIIFHFNDARAFTTFHTINLPSTGAHGRSNVAIVVHELTHVFQYEHVGSLYIGQAIHAQATIGYGYGNAAGLHSDRAAGKHYRDYNREQQAQIAQDYYTLKTTGGDTTEYEPFIAELRAGAI